VLFASVQHTSLLTFSDDSEFHFLLSIFPDAENSRSHGASRDK